MAAVVHNNCDDLREFGVIKMSVTFSAVELERAGEPPLLAVATISEEGRVLHAEVVDPVELLFADVTVEDVVSA
jgi:hypothetical protein